MSQCLTTNLRTGIRYGAVLVLLILKEVGIDRSRSDTIRLFELLNKRHIAFAIGEIPKDMQGKRRSNTCECMHLSCICELLFDRCGSGILHKLAETRSSISKGPGGNLDTKRVQSRPDLLLLLLSVTGLMRCHHVSPLITLQPVTISVVNYETGT